MDQEARAFIGEFYRKYYHKLYLQASALLRQPSEAEAAVQEAFVVACRKPEELMGSGDPLRWIRQVIKYRALHILEGKKRTASPLVSLEALEPAMAPSHRDGCDVELVNFFARAVSKDELMFFLRIARGETSIADEAARQDITPSACYKRLARIREKLRQLLQEHNK